MLFSVHGVLAQVPPLEMASLKRSPMTVQHGNQAHRLAYNLWAQMALFTAVVVILITLASKYVW